MQGRWIRVLGVALVLTLVIAGSLGPAPSKLETIGMVGWAGRAPFFLLLFYVGPVVLAARDRAPWPVVGLATGGLAGLPLALLALATACPLTVQLGYMGAAGIEGLLLARLVVSGTSHSGGDQQRGP